MKRIMLIGFVLLMTVLPISAQQMYRWVDSAGRVHYTDDPTVGVRQKAKEIDKPVLPNVSSNTTISEDEKAERNRLAAMSSDQRAQETVQRAFQKQRQCAELEKEIQTLNGRSRLVKGTNSNGSYQYASEKEAQEYKATKEAEYNGMCKY